MNLVSAIPLVTGPLTLVAFLAVIFFKVKELSAKTHVELIKSNNNNAVELAKILVPNPTEMIAELAKLPTEAERKLAMSAHMRKVTRAQSHNFVLSLVALVLLSLVTAIFLYLKGTTAPSVAIHEVTSDAHSIVVKWSVDKTPLGISVLELKDGKGKSVAHIEEDDGSGLSQFSGLKQWTQYHVILSSRDAFGRGVESDPVSIFTDAKAYKYGQTQCWNVFYTGNISDDGFPEDKAGQLTFEPEFDCFPHQEASWNFKGELSGKNAEKFKSFSGISLGHGSIYLTDKQKNRKISLGDVRVVDGVSVLSNFNNIDTSELGARPVFPARFNLATSSLDEEYSESYQSVSGKYFGDFQIIPLKSAPISSIRDRSVNFRFGPFTAIPYGQGEIKYVGCH